MKILALSLLLLVLPLGAQTGVNSLSTADTVSCASSVTFDLADQTGKSPVRRELSLTCNVTSVSFSNKTAGATFDIAITSDGTHTIAWGVSVDSACDVTNVSGAITTNTFQIAADGTSVKLKGCQLSGNLQGVWAWGAMGADCPTPPAGKLCGWLDTTDGTAKLKNSAGAVFVLPKSASSQAAHKVVDYIASTGIPHAVQLGFSDLSGAITAAQLIPPTASTFGGVKSKTTCGASAHIDSLGTDGVFTCTADAAIPPVLSTRGVGVVRPFGKTSYTQPQLIVGTGQMVGFQFTCCDKVVSIAARTVVYGVWTGLGGSSTAVAFYSVDSTGQPNALLATSAPQSSASSLAPIFATFASPPTLTAGTAYWVFISNDTGTVTYASDGASYLDTVFLENEASYPRQGLCNNSVTWTAGAPTFPSSCGGLIGLAGAHSPSMVFLP
jgi:hypothetical protein